MPKIEPWDNLPAGVRQDLIDRMRDRAITNRYPGSGRGIDREPRRLGV
jgi:hypothetical protein